MRSIALIAMAAFAVRKSDAFATLKPPRLSSRHSRSQQPLLFSPDLSVPEVAAAATSLPAPLLAASAAPNALASAVVAYLHYAGFLLSGVCLTAERLTLKEGMGKADDNVLSIADSLYGVAGLVIVVTGYLRATQFGKGWEFYAHEPIFWLKLTLLAVAGAASFFPTAIIIQRALRQRDAGEASIPPMSPRLVARMTSIVNAELLALASIPLTATTMSRGIGYAEWLPWQAVSPRGCPHSPSPRTCPCPVTRPLTHVL